MKTELVTTLKRKATELIADLQVSHDPVLITQHGKPAAVLVDIESYQALQKRLSLLEGLALGERAIREGNVVSHSDAKERFSKWLK